MSNSCNAVASRTRSSTRKLIIVPEPEVPEGAIFEEEEECMNCLSCGVFIAYEEMEWDRCPTCFESEFQEWLEEKGFKDGRGGAEGDIYKTEWEFGMANMLPKVQEETPVWQCGCAPDGFNDSAKCDACPAINCDNCMCDVMRWQYLTLKSGKKSKSKGKEAYDGEKADYYSIDRGGDYDGKQDHEGIICRCCFVERFGEEGVACL